MPVSTATDSSGYVQVVQLRRAFALFKTVRNNAQRQSLCFRQRLVSSGPIGEHTRQVDDISHPASILFLLEFHSHRLDAHRLSVPSAQRAQELRDYQARVAGQCVTLNPTQDRASSRLEDGLAVVWILGVRGWVSDLAHVDLCANHDLDGSRADLKCTRELNLGFRQQCPEVQPCRHLSMCRHGLEVEIIDSYGQLGKRRVVDRIAEPSHTSGWSEMCAYSLMSMRYRFLPLSALT